MIDASINRLWKPSDAAAYLGIHEKTAIAMARRRELPAIRIGRLWRFREADLVQWAALKVCSVSQPVE
ncbi:helix-turn-helix domain-containing protein [Granulicella cerasi]|uniref:Helix-turn-helix domain-containing protein n=1 Tax=Granulicella cerasi TaxID=741063 RepID=A0ABW1Z7Q0_9BACT